MLITPDDLAGQNIDPFLEAAGWIIQDRDAADITTGWADTMREADRCPRAPVEAGSGARFLRVSEIRRNAN